MKEANSILYPYILLDGSDSVFTGSEPETKETTSSSSSVSDDFDLIKQVQRTNDLLVGIIFFLGLIFGAIGMGIFWNRFKGD